MTVYQIVNWDQHFENARSRVIEQCSYVAMPNKQDGMGLTRILSAPDGAALFGAWCLILQACSRQASNGNQKRSGWLTDDGRPDGRPWSAEDLALRWRQPVELFERALEVFTSVKIGWMSRYDETPSSIVQVPSICLPSALEGKGREQPEGNSGAGGESPEAPAPHPVGLKPEAPDPNPSDKRKRLLGLLTARGATMTMKGADIFHEWCDVCTGFSFDEIGAVMNGPRPPKLPSDLRKALAKRKT